MTTTTHKQLEVLTDDQTPQKWCVLLREEVFKKFMSQDILLSSLRSSGQSTIDWFQTEQYYVLKAELPGEGKNSVQVYAENAKVLEISGQWKQQQQQKDQSKTNSTRDWRSGNWWESGYVRRLELPQDADWRKIEAYVTNDLILEIKIHKINNSLDADNNQNTTA
ncbi:21.7 kDa class VI heat shock protein isoform X2 [Rosa chinensis]|uniref:21.7 kDa class VI heat shock protein isoform X2 n=1 Tax=Rosa chinensis TaxID=74649 RepID=UPI001AD923A7|nr:21.7 kDa class VI heat shock protein isoform X2 [Rosa chinensis]